MYEKGKDTDPNYAALTMSYMGVLIKLLPAEREQVEYAFIDGFHNIDDSKLLDEIATNYFNQTYEHG